MSAKNAVVVRDLHKSFRLPHDKHSGLKQAALNLFSRSGYETQEVLNNVSFEIKEGEFFGIVGRNGSGKSTLLKLLAGVYKPDSGHIHINGSLTPFIELGVGFNPELTGRENVYMNGALLGFDRSEMNDMYDEIVDFAELEKFMDQKLKNYSSGMQVRLAFSIAIRAKSKILLLDEVLAVGDAIFQKKCYDYFKQLKKEKKTVIFVSHDVGALEEYCDRGILLERGRLLKIDKIDNIVNSYIEILNDNESGAMNATETKTNRHIGTGGVKVTGLKFINNKDGFFTEEDDKIEIQVTYVSEKDVEAPIYGITIFDSSGQRIFAGNNMWSHTKAPPILAKDEVIIKWSVPNIFNSGSFLVTPAVAESSGAVVLDQVEGMGKFKIRKRQVSNAYTNIEYTMNIHIK